MARALSLVVPSGHLTLGNYLGAIQHWSARQDDGVSLFGVADLHALTINHDPAQVTAITREQVATLLGAGLDPTRCVLFVQSHVAAHTQLHWLLEATAYDGELRRMIQYKEKTAKQTSVRGALLSYPVLMAADILLYDVPIVPVGEDQRQHLELARDLAIRFNNEYGETFVVPAAAMPAIAARVMDLQDPTRKMNKSADLDARGVVRLLDDPDVVREKFKRAQTDSGSDVAYDPDKKQGVSNLLVILAACTNTTPQQAAGAVGSYRELKEACAEAVNLMLGPLQARYADVVADEQDLDQILAAGAERARELADPTLRRAMKAIGLLPAGPRSEASPRKVGAATPDWDRPGPHHRIAPGSVRR